MRDAVIVSAVRTPIGRRKGAYADIHPVDLSAAVLNDLVTRTGIEPGLVDDVIWGVVEQVGDQAVIVPILQSAGIAVTDHDGHPVSFDAAARDGEYLLMAAHRDLHDHAVAVHRQGVPRWHNRFQETGPAKLGYAGKVN
jgi:acetyl-CoA acetyltransferase